MSDPNLVTTCTFNKRDYFVKMHVTPNNLELVITDKTTGEDWQCCYDSAYIENITQKTGNFKQFNIFNAMLKSGLLKTSNSVYLDLMTFDDLDALRNHRIRNPYSVYHSTQSNSNRRYLILTYTVEFDRIHYPLPLEYCGPPDPKILQQNIIKLEDEVLQLKEQIKGGNSSKHNSKTILSLQKKIDNINEENIQLHDENVRLSNLLERKSKNNNYILMLQNAIKNLEQSVMSERKSHHKLVEKLRKDKVFLSKELNKAKQSEKEMLTKLQNTTDTSRSRAIKRASDPGGTGDSRSPSPRFVKSDSWEVPMAVKPKRLHRSPHKHRNHSSDSDSSREFNLNKPKASLHKLSRTSKPETQIKSRPVSRTNSPSSRSSSGSRSSKSKHPNIETIDIMPHRTMSRASDLDFTSLESRIVALQKMLQKGFHIT